MSQQDKSPNLPKRDVRGARVRPRPYAASTLATLQYLGLQLQQERKDQRITMQDLAQRMGITRQTLHKIERGDPACDIGSYFEAAYLLGMPLVFDDGEAAQQALHSAQRVIELMPKRAVRRSVEINDDF